MVLCNLSSKLCRSFNTLLITIRSSCIAKVCQPFAGNGPGQWQSGHWHFVPSVAGTRLGINGKICEARGRVVILTTCAPERPKCFLQTLAREMQCLTFFRRRFQSTSRGAGGGGKPLKPSSNSPQKKEERNNQRQDLRHAFGVSQESGDNGRDPGP